jgi:hypothetical protein
MEHLSAFDVRGSCLPVSVQNANSWHNWIHTFLSHYCASVPEPRTFLFYFDLWLTPLPVLFVMQRMWLQSQLTAHGGRVVGGEGGCNFVRKQAQPCRATCFCASFVMLASDFMDLYKFWATLYRIVTFSSCTKLLACFSLHMLYGIS